MRVQLFLFTFCASIFCLGYTKEAHKIGLYSTNEDVIILSNTNFYDQFLGKEYVWLIEFYNSWCGHCINFAPTYSKFATYAKGWDHVLAVGAVDCANKNNSAICRQFNTEGYPTMMYFKPLMAKDNETKCMKKLSGGQSFDALVKTTFSVLLDLQTPFPKTWPKLEPLKTIADIWTETTDQHEFVFLIFEESNSMLGREVILDTMKLSNVLVRRLLKADVTKYGIQVFPSLYSVNKEGIYTKLLFGKNNINDREDFTNAVLVHSGNSGNQAGDRNAVSKTKTREQDGLQGQGHIKGLNMSDVHMQDLESAIYYSLKQEVAIKNVIDTKSLRALQNFISTLVKFFPGRPAVMAYLSKVHKWLQKLVPPMTGEIWLNKLDTLQDEKAYLPSDMQWKCCAGSEMRYRGYPCGMWTLFHTLTVSSYLSNHRINPQEVLTSIRGYMKHFFGCSECSVNFGKMAATVEHDVRTNEDTVLWLWKAHNKANKRLHGDLSEDPMHPKIQFPSRKHCPKCHINDHDTDNPSWNEKEVLKHLVNLYRQENIVLDKSLEVRNAIGGELDWWENKQRAQDLAKIKEIRRQKRQRKLEQDIFNGIHKEGVRYQIEDPHYRAFKKGWGLNGVDLGMCMLFYVMCAVIILLMYYHFTIRRNWKPCGCLPV